MNENDKTNKEHDKRDAATPTTQVVQTTHQDVDITQNGTERGGQAWLGRALDYFSVHKGPIVIIWAALAAAYGKIYLKKRKAFAKRSRPYGPNDRKLLELARTIEEIYKKT